MASEQRTVQINKHPFVHRVLPTHELNARRHRKASAVPGPKVLTLGRRIADPAAAHPAAAPAAL